MGLLDFVKSDDPFRVKTRERHLLRASWRACMEEEKKVVFDNPPMKKARARGGKISKPLLTTVGKSPTALKRLELQSGPQDSGSNQDVNVQTCCVPEGFAVVTSSSEHGDTKVSLRVKSPLPHVKVENIAAEFTNIAGSSLFLGTMLELLLLCRMKGHLAALRNQTDAGFLDSFNINSAQHACMRHAEIVALKAKLEEAKKEVAEVSGLRGHMSELEVRVVAKSEEI
ncbi:hypothetical protein Tco_1206664, partial [Tanacetum coccineum]